ncbi:hypothetical protein JGU72_06355 [Antrihabitans sp. YC2-6]|nr:hypothetical protein [Antrihabitans sp. YC2-6]MBJ8344290.1 hypothetical protein [Antrihabitans sp. YC2-6]
MLIGAGPATAAPPGLGAVPQCAWEFMSNNQVLNIAFPDTNATYWVLPYALAPGDSIQLSGTYPYARYMSLNTYGTDFNTIDTLRDNQIRPDAGSSNPFVDAAAASFAPPQRQWHATVVSGAADHERNQIQGLPSGVDPQTVPLGFLIIRVYVPDNPSSAPGGVPLPAVTLTHANGASVPLQTCNTVFNPATMPDGPGKMVLQALFDRVVAGAASGAFPGNVPEAVFVNPASTSGLFPNGDNKYIGAGLTYRPQRILVVQGRAPSFPDTRSGQTVAGSDTQVRYWSMCQNDQVSPYPVVTCAADFQTGVNGQGDYTYVVAAAGDVPARAATDPSVTVLDWGSTSVPKKVLFMRYMLPSAAFYPNSIQFSQNTGSDPASTMGPYYPRSVYCNTATFEAGGAQACFDNPAG